eukprot:sb/3465342/
MIHEINALCFIMLCFPANLYFRNHLISTKLRATPLSLATESVTANFVTYVNLSNSKPLCLFCKRHLGECLRHSPRRGKNYPSSYYNSFDHRMKITAINGNGYHRFAKGSSATYLVTESSFRVYVQTEDVEGKGANTRQGAKNEDWSITWVAIGWFQTNVSLCFLLALYSLHRLIRVIRELFLGSDNITIPHSFGGRSTSGSDHIVGSDPPQPSIRPYYWNLIHLIPHIISLIKKKNEVKSDFLKLSPPWVAREFLFARRNLVLALTPLFLGQFGQTKVLRTPKIMLFSVISWFLPKSESNESKWGLSRANTTAARQKGGDNFKKSDFIFQFLQSSFSVHDARPADRDIKQILPRFARAHVTPQTSNRARRTVTLATNMTPKWFLYRLVNIPKCRFRNPGN